METRAGGRQRVPVGRSCLLWAVRLEWSPSGRVRGALAAGGLTWVVPAASRGGAPPPVPIHLGEFPLLVGITGEGVWGQVADLQAGIVPQEVTERHPGKSRDMGIQVTRGHIDKL